MKNQGMFIPTILLPEIYFPYSKEKGFIANQVEQVAEGEFYRAIEIGCGYDLEDRKRIREVSSDAGLYVTQWMTSLIDEKSLDLSAFESKARKEAVKEIKDNLYLAAECGASNVAIISGPDSGEKHRIEATNGFYESLCEICEAASSYGINALVEPLDRKVHKKRFLGPISEAVDLISKVRESHDNMALAFDTAHAALNGENIEDALEIAQSQINQLHFSNAVLEKKDDLYGDYHIPIGKPGFLDFEKVCQILRKAEELELQVEKGLRVSIEVRGLDQKDRHANEETCRVLLQEACRSLKQV